jgi:hypothetical protein
VEQPDRHQRRRNLRALSPTNGIVLTAAFLSSYYDDHVSQAWAEYAFTTLNVDTQASFGTVTGQVSNDLLTDPNQPDGENPATYYTAPVTNHYAGLCTPPALIAAAIRFLTTT